MQELSGAVPHANPVVRAALRRTARSAKRRPPGSQPAQSALAMETVASSWPSGSR